MSYKKIIAVFLVTVAPLATADSWNSSENISRAANRALATYGTNGIDGIVSESRNCHAGLDTSYRNKNAARDIEYCIAFDIASTLIDQRRAGSNEANRSAYLNLNEAMMRGVFALEKARLITLPEQIVPYFDRFSGIQSKLPKTM